MTANPDKAMHLLKVLSEDYEKTKSPDTAEKIISLVVKELNDRSFSMAENYRQRMYRQYGLLLYIPFVKKKALSKNPFKVYWEISEEREKDHKEKEAERLCSLYSTDAKSPSQIKTEKEAVDKQVHNYANLEIDSLARAVSIADEFIGRLIASSPIVDADMDELMRSCASMIERAGFHTLILAGCVKNCKNPQEFILNHKSPYVRNLSGKFASRKMTEHVLNYELLEKNITKSMRFAHFEILNEILSERMNQITKHGYTETHDDEHTDGSIADAAAHYASTKDDTGLWPWDVEYDKKSTKTRRDQLITSISMLIAEVERLDRSEITKNTQGDSHE